MPPGIIVSLHPKTNVLVAVTMIALQLSRESNIGFPRSTTKELSCSHNSKLFFSITVTLFGMNNDVSSSHPFMASKPMFVTKSGIQYSPFIPEGIRVSVVMSPQVENSTPYSSLKCFLTNVFMRVNHFSWFVLL